MIFDMTRRVSGGGGGPSASDAILTVTVPTGSTVTMTKGGTTLTPTMWVQAADATLDCALFVIAPALFDSVNPWTVTATLVTDRATAEVTISENKQYDVSLSYTFDIFKSGYGALVTLNTYNQSNASIVIASDAITTNYSSTSSSYVYAVTNDKIDISRYSVLRINLTARDNRSFQLAVSTAKLTNADTSLPTGPTTSYPALWFSGNSSPNLSGDYDVSLTGLSDTEYYICFRASSKASISRLSLIP